MDDRNEFDPEADLALVAAVARRDASAIEQMTRRLERVAKILGAQNARMGRPLDLHDLADLTQDVVIVVLRKLDEYGGRGPLDGWIYRICCFEFMNAVRRKQRTPRPVADTEPLADVPAPESGERERVLLAIERVGGVEAEALTLKHFEGLTFEEIAARLEVPPSTIKTRYYRGIHKLEAILRPRKGVESS